MLSSVTSCVSQVFVIDVIKSINWRCALSYQKQTPEDGNTVLTSNEHGQQQYSGRLWLFMMLG